jgi:hypothetical protein
MSDGITEARRMQRDMEDYYGLHEAVWPDSPIRYGILVLGEAPARGFADTRAIVGEVDGKVCMTGRRWISLCKDAGLDYDLFDYANVSERPDLEGFTIVALGKKAADYAMDHGDGAILELPHPSGRSIKWNKLEDRRHYSSLVREFVEDYGCE